MNATTNSAATASATASAITLAKVPADYKLQPNEAFLTMGRVNKNAPARPYYHTTVKGLEAGMPAAPVTALPEMQASITKLWNAVILELLKEKASNLPAGATGAFSLNAADVHSFIADSGNRERATISGDELDAFASSYAFTALALVHNWSAAQVARVAVALRQYAAPAHRKPQADASILLTRLEALPSLLTADDTMLDADILRVYQWLAIKLSRDASQQDANLADSI